MSYTSNWTQFTESHIPQYFVRIRFDSNPAKTIGVVSLQTRIDLNSPEIISTSFDSPQAPHSSY